jgi:hypothetical protein
MGHHDVLRLEIFDQTYKGFFHQKETVKNQFECLGKNKIYYIFDKIYFVMTYNS